MTNAVSITNVSKKFRLYHERNQTLKSAIMRRRRSVYEDFWALRDVSFDVEQGSTFGLIGSNGSGKSTLLKCLAKIYWPTSGSISYAGRMAALLEVGSGFHHELSGRENIYLNGSILGMSRKEIDRKFDDIIEFSGVEQFIDQPVKNYSSGMYVRLGFAVAIHTDPEILLVDEVLAVGDEAFAHRCLRRIEELLATGRTVIFVSHALGLVEDLCSRVLWLDEGRVRLLGDPRRVVDGYRQDVAEDESRAHREAKEEREREEEGMHAAVVAEGETGEVLRWGSGAAEIVGVRLLDAGGAERYHFESGEAVTFELEAEAARPLEDFVFGVGLFSPRGVEVWGTNTDIDGLASERFAGRAKVALECPSLRLAPGEYLVDVAVHAQDGAPYDYRRKLLAFSVTSTAGGAGVYLPEHRWRFAGASGTVSFQRSRHE